MWLVVVSTIFFGILLLILTIPVARIFIVSDDETVADSDMYGQRIMGSSVSPAVLQRLFILFEIPLCVALQCVFLYFTYYRPIRYALFRVELNVQSLRNARTTQQRELALTCHYDDDEQEDEEEEEMEMGYEKGYRDHETSGGLSGAAVRPRSRQQVKSGLSYNTQSSAPPHHREQRCMHTQIPRCTSADKQHGSICSDDGSINDRQPVDAPFGNRVVNTVFLEDDPRQYPHVRPSGIKKNEYIIYALFPEISELCSQIELNFFIGSTVAEANYRTACSRVRDTYLAQVSQEALASSFGPLAGREPSSVSSFARRQTKNNINSHSNNNASDDSSNNHRQRYSARMPNSMITLQPPPRKVCGNPAASTHVIVPIAAPSAAPREPHAWVTTEYEEESDDHYFDHNDNYSVSTQSSDGVYTNTR